MIMPAVSAASPYDTGDRYADADQYGASGPTTLPYGSDYGTGVYSEYSSESGRYSTTVEIVGYGSASSSGYGYTAGGTDHGYSTDTGGTYGYTPGNAVHSYEAAVLDYVVDVLDGSVDMAYGDQFCYT